MTASTEKALLTALQEVFRKHARCCFQGDPFTFEPEWEKARVAIYDALAADGSGSSGAS